MAQAELADAYAADSYVAAGRSTNQLIDDLSSFSSIVRTAAGAELATRTSEIEQILATLESMAGDPDGTQRTGACVALGAIADPGSVPLLVDLLDDEDNHVRYFAATALLEMPQPDVYPFVYEILAVAARNATPTFPLPDEDPAQFANGQVLDLLFEHNHLIESLGSLADIDRSFLYPAIRAAVNHPLGRMRGFMKQGAIYSMLTEEDILALADVIVDGVYHKAPGDTMFSLQIRTAGMELLQPRKIAEGVPLAKIVHETHFRDGASADAIDYIGQYAGSATLVEPDPEVIEFLETFWVSDDRWDGNLWVNASAALDAIAADTNPEEPTPFKSIQSVTAEASTLTLPANRTKLRVDAFDHAKGDSRYTWRKVHGAGDVSFSPNGTAESRNSNVLFDGTPGQYLLEVTMSDSRGLTEVSQTVAVTLLSSDGTLPANTAPTADALAVDVAGATPTPVILTGSDPEGYDLSYKVISRPAHGRLVGTAPYLNYIPDFNYSGEDSFTYEVRDSEGQVSSATVNITVGATAPTGLTIYEPFDYATGALDGQSGTSEVGLSGTWSAPSSAEIISGSIGYGPVTTMGGQFTTGSPTSNTWGGSRPISSSALTAHGLLDDGATIWFSATAAASESGGYVRVALANNSFATGGGNQYIADEGTQVGAGIGFSFKADNGFSAATFGNTKEDAVIAPWDNRKSPRYYSGDFGMVVGKITWGATPQDPDTIEIYEPNTDLLLPAEPTSVLTTQVDQSTFDTLTFFRGGTPLVDEIRFGSTYRSVLLGSVAMAADAVPPVPDPPGFHAAPAPSGPASIQMVAVPAYDPHGVEYYFTCTAGGGHDSGWQSSPEYTDTGLTPGVAYSYTVKARDRSTARNETTASAAFPTTIPTSGAVPLVLSVPQAEAEALIMEKGFAVGSVTTASSSSVDQGNVAEQNPAPGATSPLGAAVDLVISETPLRATIPDLTGQTQAAATTSLSDLDLFVGTVLTDYSETVAAGQIISTNPAAGSQVVPGSDVDLLVSAGALSDLPPLTELFFDDFESPVIADPTGYNLENTTQDIDATKWVRATTGFAANRNGLVHEDENSGNTFSDPSGAQAWAGRYDTNTGLTSAFNQIGAIEAGLTITVTFDAVLDGYASTSSADKPTNGTDLEAALVLFDGAGTRDDQSGEIDAFTSAVLANLTGAQGVNGSYQTFSFSYTVGDDVIDNNGAAADGGTSWDSALLGQDLAVRFGPGNHAIIDNVRVSSEGVPLGDMVAPGLTSLSPADGTTGVGVDDDLKLVFSENVFAGNGTFTLRNETDGTRQYFSADDADTVTFSGNTVVLRPVGGLLTDKDYTVFVSAGAVEDAIGNLFAGISASDEWNFTTSSSGVPVFAVDPIIGSDATEDAAYSDTIAGSASDPDGDVLTYAKVSGPAWLAVASDGTLSGTPTNSDVGANSFTVSASDGTDTTEATLTVEVIGTNDAPVADDQSVSTYEDTNLAVTLTASDPDGDALSYSVVDAPANGILTGTAPDLTYTPDTGYTGSDSFTFVANDGTVDSNTATVSLTVNAEFVDPDTSGDVQPLQTAHPDWRLVFSDEFNGTSLDTSKWGVDVSTNSWAARSERGIADWWWVEENVSLDGSGNLVLDVTKHDSNTMYCGSVSSDGLYEPKYGYLEARIQIADSTKDTHTAFWLQGSNMGNVDGTGNDGAEVDIFESAWFGDYTKSVVHIDGYGADKQANTKQYDAPNLHSGYHTFGLEWTPNSMKIYYDGVHKVTYTGIWVPQVAEWLWLSTGASFGDIGTFADEPVGWLTSAKVDYVRVWQYDGNRAPYFVSDPLGKAPATAGTAYNDTLAGDALDDDEGDSLTYSKVAGPADDWLTIAADGSLSGTPSSASVGTNTWTIAATDTSGSSANTTLEILVNSDTGPITLVGGSLLNGNFNANSGESVTFSATDHWYNTKGLQSQVATRSDITYDGSQNATLHAGRGFGVDTGHTIAEGNVFDISYVWKDDWNWVGSEGEVKVSLFVTDDNTISGNRTDLVVDYSGIGQVADAYESVSREQVYTATAADAGKTLFAAIETDSSGFARLDNVEFRVSSPTSDNSAPVASDDSYTIDEDTAVAVTLTANDVDGDTLTYTVVTAPTNGILTGTAPSLTYTPNSDYKGSDSFTFVANDGTVDSNTATVSLTVNAVNDAPVFTSDPFAATDAMEDAAYSDTIAGSASDAEGDSLSYAKVDGPSWLAVAGDGTLSGTPGNSDVGANAFTVSVTDGNSTPVEATLNITVLDSNDSLVFADDFESPVIADPTGYDIVKTTQDIDTNKWVRTDTQAYAAKRNGLVHEDENGGNTFSDPTGSQAWAGRYDTNTGITSAFNQIGAIAAGQTITVTFDAVLDGYASSASAAKQTNGTDLEAALVLFDGAGTRNDQSGEIDDFTSAVLANLTGDQGVNSTYQTFSFSYTVGDAVIDSNGGSSGGTTTWDSALLGQDIAVRFGPGNHAIIDNVSVSISGSASDNSAPVASDDSYTIDEDTNLAVTLTASDPDGDVLGYSVVTAPANGTLSGTAPALTYTPDPDFTGSDSFTFVANDGTVDSNTATVSLTVNSVNDAPVFTSDPFAATDAMEDAAYSDTIAGSASDAEGDSLSYAKVDGPSWLAVAGDGLLSGTPGSADVGANSFTVSVTDGIASPVTATLNIQVIGNTVADYAYAETLITGTVSGSITDTFDSNNVYEVITEDETKGKPTDRYSYLEHKWEFDVIGGDVVTFNVEAHHSANGEGDDFIFAYSATGVNGAYTDMLVVTKTTDNDAEQSFTLPAGTSGIIHVRLRDTDQTPGNRNFDSLSIDHMYILSQPSTP